MRTNLPLGSGLCIGGEEATAPYQGNFILGEAANDNVHPALDLVFTLITPKSKDTQRSTAPGPCRERRKVN